MASVVGMRRTERGDVQGGCLGEVIRNGEDGLGTGEDDGEGELLFLRVCVLG